MTRRLVEAFDKHRRLDIRDMRRSGSVPDNAAEFTAYLSDGSKITVGLLRRTLGQRTGVRLYFHCPRCHRACELLYVAGNRLACRVCLQLAYHTENLGKISRNTQRLYRLRRKLGQEPNGAFDYPPDRPTGMHWYTYDRKIEQLEQLEERANAMLNVSMGRLLARIG